METTYKRTLAGSVGAGMGAIFNGSGRSYYILEHKTQSEYHNLGESQKIIVDQIELGRDSSCQVRFDEKCETVSRRHAAIVKDGENWKIIPLSQTNATFVNGQRIESERILNSGDEIQLSSHGPIMGFIIPQGEQSLVKSIGMTERLNLFRKQALRPYKTALIITFIVLILAVSGLVALNIYNNKVANERIDNAMENLNEANALIENLKEQDAANKEKMTELTDKADKAEADRKAAQIMLDSLKEKSNATQAELDAAKERLQKAENVASVASRAARDAKEAATETQKQLSEAQAAAAAAAAEVKAAEEQIQNKKDDKQSDSQSSKEEKVSAPKEFADIAECNGAVYYIKMNNVTVWDEDNRVVVDLNCEKLVGGTGFLLEDGRFITARRVVEPWFYFINSDENLRTRLGRDSKGNYWYFEDIQVCVNRGLKVVANYTAYSPSGANFQFKSSDMRTNKNTNGVNELTYNNANGRVTRLFRAESFKLHWFNTNPGLDWASMQKRDQLLSVKGLKYSDSYSSNPVGGTEVSILGYPQTEGFSDSQVINPVLLRNNINVSGLNDQSVIEMASRRYKVGNDGSPVFVKIDDVWTVIGILGHTDGSDRDVVTPIVNTNK